MIQVFISIPVQLLIQLSKSIIVHDVVAHFFVHDVLALINYPLQYGPDLLSVYGYGG
jgi:hypothetical protein